jgi:hypothetical protein
VYKYADNAVFIVGQEGIKQLKGAGEICWTLADGKHTVEQIVDAICNHYHTDDKNKVYDNLIILMKKLARNNLLVMNWDPLYKFELDQGGECL